jgi:hypothetical protein
MDIDIWRGKHGHLPDARGPRKTARPFTPYQAGEVVKALCKGEALTEIGRTLSNDANGIANCTGSRVRNLIEASEGVPALLLEYARDLPEAERLKVIERYAVKKQKSYED